MKRVLFGVDSVFQLILSTNLRTTIYKDCKADIVIYNSVPSAGDLCEKLRQTGVFGKVYFGNTSMAKCGNKYTKKEKLPKYFSFIGTLFAPKMMLEDIIGDKFDGIYDEFLFNSYGAFPECIFNACYKNNPNIKCKRFEDSYVSYFTVYGSKKGGARQLVEKIANTILCRKNIVDYIDGIYFEEPDLVLTEFPYPVIAAPKLRRDNLRLKDTLNKVFGYEADYIYKEKDIYLFEDGRLFFDGNEEEVDIIQEIIKTVSKEKVVVKTHPRRKENRFAPIGVDVAKGSKCPWEIIQLNNNFDGKCFLTVSSAVAFSSDVYFGDACHKVLLYKCLKKAPSSIDARFERYIEAFRKKFGEDSLIIPNSYEELAEFFKKNY